MTKILIKSAFLALLLASVWPVLVSAGPKPFPDFQAKRIKPPKPGVRPRIDVQIESEKPDGPESPPDADAPDVGGGGMDWFWESVSPELSASGPGRLEVALSVLAGARATVPKPRLQALQDIARAHGVSILVGTVGTRVSPALVLAMISVESGGRTDALSAKGAVGLMQLMPDTITRFEISDPADPKENIHGGVRYLDSLMERFGGDPILVLAAYNAGQNAVMTHAGVPPFPETRDYVPRVLAAFSVAKGLCRTPPELISDGCVFVGLN